MLTSVSSGPLAANMLSLVTKVECQLGLVTISVANTAFLLPCLSQQTSRCRQFHCKATVCCLAMELPATMLKVQNSQTAGA